MADADQAAFAIYQRNAHAQRSEIDSRNDRHQVSPLSRTPRVPWPFSAFSAVKSFFSFEEVEAFNRRNR